MRARHVLPAINAAPRPVAPRFWAKVARGADNECWPWQANLSRWGYGTIRIGQHTYIASRIAYALTKGIDPGELLVCHTCDNPACCNPSHLWLGTDGDNHRDMMSKSRNRTNGVKGERHMWTKLTEKQVRHIKTSGESGKSLARKFGVAQTAISEIRQGRNWAWLKVGNERNPADEAKVATEKKAAQVAELYLSGLSAREIASKLGLPFYTNVYPLLRRAGVTFRHRPEANRWRDQAA